MKKFNKSFYRCWLLAAIGCFVLFVGRNRAQSHSLKIGTATKIITPKTAQWLQGAGINKQKVTEVRDNLEANGLYLATDSTQILMVSCDVVGLEPDYNTRLREAMGVAAGIPPRGIIIAATHTHGGPSLVPTNPIIPLDTLYMEKLKGWLVSLAKEAVHSARPGKIGWATGKAQIGWNRRFTWANGYSNNTI